MKAIHRVAAAVLLTSTLALAQEFPSKPITFVAVSYTHLTLPTIYSV